MVSRATTQAAIPGQSGTCGSATMSSTLGGTYTAKYAYTNLGQLWQGPQNGTGTQEQYLYCDSSHPHQLSNLSQVSSSPTCSSKGTIDYTGSYDAWGNTTSQQRGSTTTSTAYDAQDHLLHWSSSVSSQQEWYLYDASDERVLRHAELLLLQASTEIVTHLTASPNIQEVIYDSRKAACGVYWRIS